MIKILSKIFINKTMTEEEVRGVYGVMCSTLGICLNILLCVFKLFAGIISSSVSITADALNNLSDAGSSIISLIGFKLAGQKPDSKHPYGHGRMEYISAFVVSAVIIAMGLALLKESVMKIVHPTDIDFSVVAVVIMITSIAVKAYMATYNLMIGKKISSVAMKAVASDSLGDCLATSVVLVTMLIARYQGINLDGVGGLIVSLVILFAGFSALKESIDPLLGTPPEEEYVEKIKKMVVEFDENIIGVHDLMIHDYGPGRKFISLHAEVPSDGDILVLHDIIDNLEKKLNKEFSCIATIHMDPIVINDPRVLDLKQRIKDILVKIDNDLSIHDFRVVWGESHTNLVFDIEVPFACKYSEDKIVQDSEQLIKQELGKNYYTIIEVDRV